MNPDRPTRPFVRLLLLALVACGGASLRALTTSTGTTLGGGPQTGTGTTDLVRSVLVPRTPPPPPPPESTDTETVVSS